MDISIEAISCAARHFVAAHESAVTGSPVDFGAVCERCDLLPQCRGNWLDTAKPIFEASSIRPMVLRKDLMRI